MRMARYFLGRKRDGYTGRRSTGRTRTLRGPHSTLVRDRVASREHSVAGLTFGESARLRASNGGTSEGLSEGFREIFVARFVWNSGGRRHAGERGRENADDLLAPLARRQGKAGPSGLEGQGSLLQQAVKRARACPLHLLKEGICRAGLSMLGAGQLSCPLRKASQFLLYPNNGLYFLLASRLRAPWAVQGCHACLLRGAADAPDFGESLVSLSHL